MADGISCNRSKCILNIDEGCAGYSTEEERDEGTCYHEDDKEAKTDG